MAELKTETQHFRMLAAGDGEYHLRMEEEKRDCLKCQFLAATDTDGTEYPAILLRDRIKNKKAYEDTTVHSWWTLLMDRLNTQKVLFLKLDFVGAGTMKFCLDLSPGFLNRTDREELMIWLRYVTASGGKIALIDGTLPDIMAAGIYLDVPRMLLNGEI